MEKTPLTTNSHITHQLNGAGRIISMFDNGGIDMVEVLWTATNMVEDIGEDSLRKGLTRIVECSKKSNHWAALAGQEA